MCVSLSVFVSIRICIYVRICLYVYTHTIIDLCYKTHYIRKSERNLLLKETPGRMLS